MKLSIQWLIALMMAFALLTAANAVLQPTELTPTVKSQLRGATLHGCVTPYGLKFYSNRPCGEIIEGSH